MPTEGDDNTTKIKCVYCRKPVDGPPEMVLIYDRVGPWPNQTLRKRTLSFCSAKCGAHHQMGCEG